MPASALPSDTLITATLTMGIQDLASNPLAAIYSWTFRIKDSIPPQSDLSLRKIDSMATELIHGNIEAYFSA